MGLRWNAKANVATELIMWIGSILAVIICVIWLTKNLSDDPNKLEIIDYEMSNLQEIFSTACNVDYYQKKYNPWIDEGNLLIYDNFLCIDSNPCKGLYYKSKNDFTVEPGRIVIKDAARCNTLRDCKAVYYESENEPQIVGDDIIIENITVCDQNSITRCRVLLCSTKINATVDLTDITYVIIERNNTFQDGAFQIFTS